MTYLLHAHRAHLVARLDALLDGLAEDEPTEEAAGEGVAGTVGVDDLRVGEGRDGEDGGRVERVAADDRRGLGAVRDDDGARAGGVRLGERGEGARDAGEVGLVREARRGGVRLGLGFVPDDDVAVGEDLLELGGEELGDEGRGEVQDEDLCEGDSWSTAVPRRGEREGSAVQSSQG